MLLFLDLRDLVVDVQGDGVVGWEAGLGLFGRKSERRRGSELVLTGEGGLAAELDHNAALWLGLQLLVLLCYVFVDI